MKSNKKDSLPNKPSELLILALTDFEQVEAKPRKFHIDMTCFYILDIVGSRKCHVCLAGSILAMTLNKKRIVYSSINLTPPTIHLKLRAIDHFRSGDIGEGLHLLNITHDSLNTNAYEEYKIPEYEKDPIEFKNWIQDLIGIFQAEGL